MTASDNELLTSHCENGPAADSVRSRPVSLSAECRQVRHRLPLELLNDLDEASSEKLCQHLRNCRSCLEAYIALQAAAALAWSEDAAASE